MIPGGYHIILVPPDATQTKRLHVTKSTARLVGLGLLLLVPFLAGALYVAVHYQNKFVALKREISEEKQILEQKELLDTRLAEMEKAMTRTEESIGRVEQALDVDAGQMKSGLGPVEEMPSLSAADSLGDFDRDDALTARIVRTQMTGMDKRIQALKAKVEDIFELNRDKLRYLSAMPNAMPVAGWVTSDFGIRRSPTSGVLKMHYGLDVASPVGTPIYAPADGTVLMADYSGGYGREVILDHGYGVTTVYAHSSQIFVKEGQKVRKGDIIAAVGSTGSSTGPHLHYEVHVDGIPTNPLAYIPNRSVN